MIMENPIESIKQSIKESVLLAYQKATKAGELPLAELQDFDVEVPKDSKNGDFSTNFAMKNVKALKAAPQKIGTAVIDNFDKENTMISDISLAGPGFINITLSEKYYSNVLKSIDLLKENYGKTKTLKNEKIMVEFVSANPTGPMHMGNARGGVVGDSLASILSWAGADVHREFYINDSGNQVALFGASLNVRYIQELKGEDAAVFPEDGYHGEDIRELAKIYIKENGDSLLALDEDKRIEKLIEFGLAKNIERMKSDLANYKISYDLWFPESTLHKSGYVKETIELLQEKGYLYEKEGAIWFRTTDFGCEKDEVMVKANGFYTYYAVDIAYHRNKFLKRGFDRVIDVLGADHHGHTLRFKAGMKALGIDPEKLQFVLMQLVRLTKDGEIVRMSKRTGKAITLKDLLEEISVDAARFYFNLRQCDTHLDFDLSLATRNDSENPVYYVQYAHARICSILKNLELDGKVLKEGIKIKADLLKTEEEKELIKLLASFPEEIVLASGSLEPSKITKYAIDLATAFHKFYNACKIKGEDDELLYARLSLANCVKQVIANTLSILKVLAPEKM